jgi:dynactin 1
VLVILLSMLFESPSGFRSKLTFGRIQAQFDHLAETYFDQYDHDLGERELGYVLSFDRDLDMFAASIGLTKTSVVAIVKDDGMESVLLHCD